MRHGVRVLAAVAAANLLVAVVHFGIAAAAPWLRSELELTSTALGALLATVPAGLMLGTFGWGVLADRIGERRVLAVGMSGWAASTIVAAFAGAAGSAVGLGAALLVAGTFGSSAHSAGGRAITATWPDNLHGAILAIRHTAIPIGGAVGGLLVPLGLDRLGFGPVLVALALAGLAVAVALAVVVPGGIDRARDVAGFAPTRSPLRVPELWLLGGSCSLLAFTQLGIGSFLTVRLVDGLGWSVAVASVTFALANLGGAAARVVVGIGSDRPGWRIRSLALVAASSVVLVVASGLAADRSAGGVLLAAALLVTTSWNGAAVAAAASFAPVGRTGSALGMQTTMFATMGAIAPVAVGALLHASGWRAVEALLACALGCASAGLVVLTQRAARGAGNHAPGVHATR